MAAKQVIGGGIIAPGEARLLIILPDDRVLPGRATLLDASGVLFEAECLGRAVPDYFAPKGAASRLTHDGDTPLGLYASTRMIALPQEMTGIGRLFVPLHPRDGEAADAERAGRTGLGVHGGRGDGKLRPTRGCVRLRDKDLARLALIAGERPFDVLIKAA